MPAPKKGVADYIAKKIAKKAVVKVKPKPNTKAMPKSNVKVKPAAKSKPNKPNAAKIDYQTNSSRARAGNTAYRQNIKDQSKANYSGYGQGSHGDASIEAMIAENEAVRGRKTRINLQKSMGIKPAKRPKGRKSK